MTHKSTTNSVDSLLKIMRTLRSPEGCPWDAEQTPESLSPYIIEEACELVDAIENGNLEQIRDELGDLLLQVVFQAQIFSERKQFNFEDIAQSITDKLLRRHPHVFDDDRRTQERLELDQQWEEIKRKESTNTKSCLADHLPSRLPALQRAQKLISKAQKTDRKDELPDPNELLKGFFMYSDNSLDRIINEESVGMLIFQVTMLANEVGVDAETALRKTIQKVLQQMDSK